MNEVLEASEAKDREAQDRIKDLGARLNAALALSDQRELQLQSMASELEDAQKFAHERDEARNVARQLNGAILHPELVAA